MSAKGTSMRKQRRPATMLRRMRKACELTQSELAATLGISQKMVSKQERTGCRSARTAERYAKVFQCRPAVLAQRRNEGRNGR